MSILSELCKIYLAKARKPCYNLWISAIIRFLDRGKLGDYPKNSWFFCSLVGLSQKKRPISRQHQTSPHRHSDKAAHLVLLVGL